MGASSSNTFSQEVKNPTRCVRTCLELDSCSGSNGRFRFVQDMRKGVGEEQSLHTRVVYTGKSHRIDTDKFDLQGRRIIGNEQLSLEVLEVKFEVEWGSEAYQGKKGVLIREDVHEKIKESKLKNLRQFGVKKSGSGGHSNQVASILTSNNNNNTNLTTPASNSSISRHLVPSQAAQQHQQQSQQAQQQLNLPALLPPPLSSLPRGYSQSAPLSPAPRSAAEHTHIDTDSGLTIQPQALTSERNKIISTSTSLPSIASTSSSSSSASNPSSPVSTSINTSVTENSDASTLKLSSPSFCLPPSSESLPRTFSSRSSIPRRLTILENGLHHAALQKATSLEEMYELLQRDTPEWYGTFSVSALVMQVEMLSSQVKIQYYKPKFEYLWAQVQDECPIIMALSNVFHDPIPCELYFERDRKAERKSWKQAKLSKQLPNISIGFNGIPNETMAVETM